MYKLHVIFTSCLPGQLHIEGLGPEQQQVFINSIKEQQAQQIHAAQMARVLPQQHLINQVHTYYLCTITRAIK